MEQQKASNQFLPSKIYIMNTSSDTADTIAQPCSITHETVVLKRASSRPVRRKIQTLVQGEAVVMAGESKISNSNEYQYYEFQIKG